MSQSPIAVNRRTLAEQVLESLRQSITTGALRPGDALVETELADTYQVSRGTVREALRTLQGLGLVEGASRGGLRVHQPTPAEIRELFHVRGALEAQAVREIMLHDGARDVAVALRKALPPASGVDFTTALNKDLAFHELLCMSSGNQTLVALWRSLQDRMRTVLFSGTADRPLPLMGRDHHEPIVAAIEAGDVVAAHEVVAAHMQDAADHWSREPQPRA